MKTEGAVDVKRALWLTKVEAEVKSVAIKKIPFHDEFCNHFLSSRFI